MAWNMLYLNMKIQYIALWYAEYIDLKTLKIKVSFCPSPHPSFCVSLSSARVTIETECFFSQAGYRN